MAEQDTAEAETTAAEEAAPDVAPEATPEAAPETSQEIVTTAARSITQRMRGRFDAGQVKLIQATVAKELDDPGELAIFLETCARHELDPFIKEIWAYKLKGRVVIQASVAGLLSIANRHTPSGKYHTEGSGMFLGCASAVVHEHDFFDIEVDEREDGTEKVRVLRSPRDAEGKPTFGGKDGKDRGEIVGSWARCRRQGHDDVFVMAYRADYDKGAQVWASHKEAMMQKCAESIALRKAFSIAGVIGEGEMVQSTRTTATSPSAGGGDGEIHWPESEEITSELRKRFEALNYRRAKVRMLVNACADDDAFKALIDRLDGEVDRMHLAEEEQPPEVEVVDAEVA